jgi:hypothetical protein
MCEIGPFPSSVILEISSGKCVGVSVGVEPGTDVGRGDDEGDSNCTTWVRELQPMMSKDRAMKVRKDSNLADTLTIDLYRLASSLSKPP